MAGRKTLWAAFQIVSVVAILCFVVMMQHIRVTPLDEETPCTTCQETPHSITPIAAEKEKEEEKERKASYTIITAASANHFCALESMLYLLQDLRLRVPKDAFPRIIVYDLGIEPTQVPVLNNLHQHHYVDEVVAFNYSSYPSFWNIGRKRGEYAWKTGIVKEVQERIGGILLWLDTGDVPNLRFILTMPQLLRQFGFWSPRSTGYMDTRFNHPSLFEYYKADQQEYASRENCNGAVLGFNADDERVVQEIITPWYECGRDLDCIAPKGSSRLNHRQDQSAISFLALRAGFRCHEYPEFHGVTIHQDDQCHVRLMHLNSTQQLLHPSSIDI
ncbi:hypothetical protein BDF14DRAFT_1878278 [Spinellus fusiger]|nr:hypothetical protein BDF14DRAFT_1878278 [Spinellus fusiger]